MRKRTFMLLTVILSVIFLSACSSEGTSLKTTEDGVDIKAGDSSSGTKEDIFENNNGNNSSSNNNDSSGNSSDINSILTPSGAVVAERAYGHIFLTSTQSYTDLVTFYTTAVKNLGAKETILLESLDTKEWGYGGLYDGNNETPLVIMITPWQDKFRILIAYDTGGFTAYELPPNSIFEGKTLRAK